MAKSFAVEFFNQIKSHAEEAARRTDMPVAVIMSQWALESDYGRSDLAQRSGNLGGIKYSERAQKKFGDAYGQTKMYANYFHDLGAFVDDYVRVMNLSHYDHVRGAGGVEDTIKALSNSLYAESKYDGGGGLLAIVDKFNLADLKAAAGQNVADAAQMINDEIVNLGGWVIEPARELIKDKDPKVVMVIVAVVMLMLAGVLD